MIDISSESYIAGALLVDAERTISLAENIITADDFESERFKALWEAAKQRVESKTPSDPVALKQDCESAGHSFDDKELVELMKCVPTVENTPTYAERLKESANKRRVTGVLSEALASLAAGASVHEIRGSVEAGLSGVADVGQSMLVSSAEAATSYCNQLEKVSAGEKLYVPTGYTKLDKLLAGGLRKSGLYFIAARPGGGKSAMGLEIAENVSKTGKNVVFITLEMSTEQVTERRISARTGFSSVALNSLTPDDKEAWKRITRAAGEISMSKVMFNRMGRVSIPMLERLARAGKAELLVVDYIGLLQDDGRSSIYEKVTKFSNQLKQLALSMNIPILCLSQLNRNAAEGEPRLSDLRDSGALEQDADGVILQWLPDGRPEDNISPAFLEEIVAKNRYGALGKVPFSWYMSVGRIRE